MKVLVAFNYSEENEIFYNNLIDNIRQKYDNPSISKLNSCLSLLSLIKENFDVCIIEATMTSDFSLLDETSLETITDEMNGNLIYLLKSDVVDKTYLNMIYRMGVYNALHNNEVNISNIIYRIDNPVGKKEARHNYGLIDSTRNVINDETAQKLAKVFNRKITNETLPEIEAALIKFKDGNSYESYLKVEKLLDKKILDYIQSDIAIDGEVPNIKCKEIDEIKKIESIITYDSRLKNDILYFYSPFPSGVTTISSAAALCLATERKTCVLAFTTDIFYQFRCIVSEKEMIQVDSDSITGKTPNFFKLEEWFIDSSSNDITKYRFKTQENVDLYFLEKKKINTEYLIKIVDNLSEHYEVTIIVNSCLNDKTIEQSMRFMKCDNFIIASDSERILDKLDYYFTEFRMKNVNLVLNKSDSSKQETRKITAFYNDYLDISYTYSVPYIPFKVEKAYKRLKDLAFSDGIRKIVKGYTGKKKTKSSWLKIPKMLKELAYKGGE